MGREHAVEFIIRTVRNSPEKVVLVPTGPLTNIAMALTQAPDIIQNIERIVIMGGAIYDPGNITSAAEFNIYQDPEAARIVLNSGCTIYLNTLDISRRPSFTRPTRSASAPRAARFPRWWRSYWTFSAPPTSSTSAFSPARFTTRCAWAC